MKYILPTIVSIPTIFMLAIVAYWVFTGRYLFQELGIPYFFGLLPVLSFTTCIAIIFVFPNAKKWKIAAIVNGIPFLIIVLVLIFFAMIGYHG